ncbi:hypothetical protein K493DRAFT_285371 [Basidiobolus meristosporus CBS 931.73]|uniref:Uncharacterized protein n=1 Tax=Basidiobolus meristosporus CBS 931.73 TaxID=1314790 RepID=A0A1Y1Y457_9FUNG|nr:hypothetical protein K493DRAFT_285371 [Basidiobolus meristosporus CBS 931.73]|eukprot:ORX92812.1 hypothetical protein K493DRAFT_285371 [Basidiobolus meristosporus CBS 931.73]
MTHFSDRDVFLMIIGFFLPPFSVLIKRGCGADFLINIGLSMLGHVPGILHCWYLVYKYNDYAQSDLERGQQPYQPLPQQPAQNPPPPANHPDSKKALAQNDKPKALQGNSNNEGGQSSYGAVTQNGQERPPSYSAVTAGLASAPSGPIDGSKTGAVNQAN